MSTKVVVPDSIISTAASRVPDAYELGRHRLGLGGKDVLLQPLAQRQVVREAAVHHHRRVRMGVDQSGEHHLVRARRSSRPPDTSTQSPPGLPTSTMSTAVDRDGARSQDCVGGVLGHDGAAGDHQRHRTPRLRTERNGSDGADDQRAFHTSDSTSPPVPASPVPQFAPVYSDAVPVHIVDHPLVHDALVSLRDKTTPPEAFRRAATRISVLLAAEALRAVATVAVTVETPLGPAPGRRISRDVVVVPFFAPGSGCWTPCSSSCPMRGSGTSACSATR
jgi:hypothetical protein